MDLSLSLETQSNLWKDHQEAVSASAQKRRPPRLLIERFEIETYSTTATREWTR